MAKTQNKTIQVQALRKIKVETTYEYVPIIGEILGFWRRQEVSRAGESVSLHIVTPLSKYDGLFVNGEEIPLPKSNEEDCRCAFVCGVNFKNHIKNCNG